MMDGSIWEDPAKSSKVVRESKKLKNQVRLIDEVDSLFEEAQMSCELLQMGEKGFEKEAEETFKTMIHRIDELESTMLLHGEYDGNNCIFNIQAGTGGLDAQDWADIMLRMYLKFFSNMGFSVRVLDLLEDKEAGIKHASLLVEGENAYGYLRSEDGVHRLVRISPYNSSGKRQTSFASVEVIPEFEHPEELQINEEELRIDTYRSGGAGGQHVNTTDSAVRITHIPTGIVVQCQNERSQIQNRETAMKVLASKLNERMMEQQQEKVEDLKGDSKTITWGSQIRSYVMHPYTMVKDHRTNFENGNIDAVLGGDLFDFVMSYLRENVQ